MNCAKCGSDKIMTDVKLLDRGHFDQKHELSIEFSIDPKALIMKEKQKGAVKAIACGNCGYIELSVEKSKELWELYIKNR